MSITKLQNGQYWNTDTINKNFDRAYGNLGEIKIVYSDVPPYNCLPCNGQEISSADYPDFKQFCVDTNNGLYNAITAKLVVPNLNGKFIRSIGYSDDALGTIRDSATFKVTGILPDTVVGAKNATGLFSTSRNYGGRGTLDGGDNNYADLKFDNSNVVNTSDEVRPDYMAIQHYIVVK